MNFNCARVLSVCLFITFTGHAQTETDKPKRHLSSANGETTFGIGLGLPYGALGVRFGTNVTDGLNLFGGIGYHFAGLGYNVGVLKDFPSSARTQFYLTGMYGTNAAVKIEGTNAYDKVYTGPTVGLGIKINSLRTEGNYWDIGLLVPFWSEAFKSNLDKLDNDPNIVNFMKPPPVLLVVGYNFNL